MSFVIWITGPSGVGKTTLAKALVEKLRDMGYNVELLDGDGIRSKLYPDLGFSERGRCTTGLSLRWQSYLQIME